MNLETLNLLLRFATWVYRFDREAAKKKGERFYKLWLTLKDMHAAGVSHGEVFKVIIEYLLDSEKEVKDPDPAALRQGAVKSGFRS